MSKYLDFRVIISGGKTKYWSVCNLKSGTELGLIKWYGAWRQYCYFPSIQAVYSAGCLEDIAEQLKTAMREEKKT